MKIYSKEVGTGLSSLQLHEAAYTLLCDALRTDWNIDHIVIEKTEAGKPYLKGTDLEISVSHTQGFVCCAVSETPIGVDCEHLRTVSEKTMQRVCTETELEDICRSEDLSARFLLYWTLKESISKKCGVGLRESFRQYEITFIDEKPVCGEHILYVEQRGRFFVAAAE